MTAGILIDRAGVYRDDVLACLKLGATLRDRLRLIWYTITFHAANILRLKPRPAGRKFSIVLKNRRAEIVLRSFSGDIFVFQEVLGQVCYRLPPLRKTDGVIVDLGANIGMSALYLADLFQPSRIICVEPNPRNVLVLRQNLAALGPAATIIHGAIADSTGTVAFDDEGATYGGTIVETGDHVPSYRMTDLVRRYVHPDRIRLLKVDIEGAERMLFQGDLEWLNLVDNIIIELHPGVSHEDFEHTVAPFGLQALWADSDYGNHMTMAVRHDS